MEKEKVSQTDLDRAFYVAQKFATPMTIKSPFSLLEQTTQVCCQSQEQNGTEVDLIVKRLLQIPMSLHKNVLNSYVNLWAKKFNLKNKVDDYYEKIDEKKLNADDQQLLDVLKNALADVQDMVDPGYRTPLILLNMLYVKRSSLDQISRQVVKAILDTTDDDLCALTGAWLKQVASWQN